MNGLRRVSLLLCLQRYLWRYRLCCVDFQNLLLAYGIMILLMSYFFYITLLAFFFPIAWLVTEHRHTDSIDLWVMNFYLLGWGNSFNPWKCSALKELLDGDPIGKQCLSSFTTAGEPPVEPDSPQLYKSACFCCVLLEPCWTVVFFPWVFQDGIDLECRSLCL